MVDCTWEEVIPLTVAHGYPNTATVEVRIRVAERSNIGTLVPS